MTTAFLFARALFGQVEQRVATLKLPPGFRITVFASRLGYARMLAFSPSGVLYASNTRDGEVLALPDAKGEGRAGRAIVVATGLKLPHGLAFRGRDLYVAETDRVLVLKNADPPPASPISREALISGLPSRGMHFTRTILFGRDGKLYLAAGSDCNACRESDLRRAGVTRYNADGSGEEVYAHGLRNAVGLRLHPHKDEIWATDNGRDWLGDDLPPDEINILTRAGQDFGWPYCYGKRVVDPGLGSAARCASTEPSALDLQAHSAALGLEFYSGSRFPEPYRSSLYVCYHGSWNRSVPTGYKVVRVALENDRPARAEDFITGWLLNGRAWGRPVDVVTGPDGALYVSDDRNGAVYRVNYESRKFQVQSPKSEEPSTAKGDRPN